MLKTDALALTLGYPMVFHPEWAMLWNTLLPFYPDAAIFVPSIASAILMWYEAFNPWIEDEKNEKDVDRLLDGLGRRGVLEIVIEVKYIHQRRRTVAEAI